MVLLDELQKLPNLIAFRFSMRILHIQQLVNVGMHKDVITPTNAVQPKPKCLNQTNEIIKPNRLRTSKYLSEKFPRLHTFPRQTATLVRLPSAPIWNAFDNSVIKQKLASTQQTPEDVFNDQAFLSSVFARHLAEQFDNSRFLFVYRKP